LLPQLFFARRPRAPPDGLHSTEGTHLRCKSGGRVGTAPGAAVVVNLALPAQGPVRTQLAFSGSGGSER